MAKNDCMTLCQSCLELPGSVEICSSVQRVRTSEGVSGEVEAQKAALVHDIISTAQTVASLQVKAFSSGIARLGDPIFKLRK